MFSSDYQSASALLFDRQSSLRHTTRSALLNIGFGEVEAIRDMDELVEYVNTGEFDLVLADTGVDSDNVNDIISQLRHNVIGKNPFVTVIITLWDAETENVHAAINSGADDLLMRPTSTNIISDRLTSLVKFRKPFIVTSDYIGPERRTGQRADTGISSMVVPNSLRAKVENNPDFAATPEAIRLAMDAVNERKISSYSERLLFLISKMSPATGMAVTGANVDAWLTEMKTINEDLLVRIASADLGHVSALCDALKNAIQIVQAKGDLENKDHELLVQIGYAIHKGCKDVHDSSAHGFDIRNLTTKIKEKSYLRI